MLDKLEECIKSEILIGKQFLEIVRTQKDAIIKNRIEDIDSLTQKANETVDQFEELGYSRQDLVLEITKKEEQLRITESLKDLISQLSDDLREKFNSLRIDLMSLYEAIVIESKLNGELLVQSAGVTQHLFNRFSEIDKRIRLGKNNYTANGYKKKAQWVKQR